MDFGFWIKIAQFVLSFSILVVLHELGHFLPAKWFRTRVEKFYLFFNPWFSLFKKKIGGTEYGIGWIPLGGYVKIAGMIDESMDTDQLKKPAEPWEFRSKPAWQRLIIMLGGVVVNFILAGVIFSVMSMTYGVETISPDIAHGIVADSTYQQMGFQTGDKIRAVDNEPISDLKVLAFMLVKGDSVLIEREGEVQKIKIDVQGQKVFTTKLKNKEANSLPIRTPFGKIDSVLFDSPAYKAGILKGDSIIEANGSAIGFTDQFTDVLHQNKGKIINLVLMRNSQKEEVTLQVTAEQNPKIGVLYSRDYFEKILTYKKNNLAEAIPYGFKKTVSSITDQVSGLKILTKDEGWKNLSGLIGIARAFPSDWNWYFFWGFTAMLSAWLAFFNLLPIPALDGGHVVFVLYEMITKKQPSQKVLEVTQIIGFIVIMALFVLTFGIDIINGWFD